MRISGSESKARIMDILCFCPSEKSFPPSVIIELYELGRLFIKSVRPNISHISSNLVSLILDFFIQRLSLNVPGIRETF